jgi:heat shock protein HslJ
MGWTSAARARRRAGAGAIAIVLALVLAGCRPPTGQGIVGRYRVTAIYNASQEPVPLIAGTTISLELGADGRLGGQACNSYFGQWTSPGNQRLSIGDIGSTDMACLEPAGTDRQEHEYLTKLGEAKTWFRQGRTLSLGTQGEPSALLIRAEAV